MRGLVQLAVEKLIVDIEHIVRDEALFAHLIDEVLAFETELRNSLGYPNSLPSVMSVLLQPVYFLKWMAIEEKCEYAMPFSLPYSNRKPISFIPSQLQPTRWTQC